MQKIRNKVEYDELIENISECLKWYERRDFNGVVYNLVMDNGEKIRILFDENTVAHLLGINTEYLKSTGMFNARSYDILKQLCNNSYRLYNLISQGSLTYDSFISDFAQEKVAGFKTVCGISDLYNIEFICKYDKRESYDTGYKEQVGDYYIAYRTENGLFVIGFKKNGMYYYPITNRYVNFDDEQNVEFLHSLLKKQHITMPRLSNLYFLNTGSNSKSMYVDYHKKASMLRSLEEYSRKYGAEVNILEGYRLVNEKLIRILNSNSSMSPIYERIFEKIVKRVSINIKNLEREFGILPENIISLIDSYNDSLDTDIRAAVDEHTQMVISERDRLREENQRHIQELEAAKAELLSAQALIAQLQEENIGYRDREAQIKRVLSI